MKSKFIERAKSQQWLSTPGGRWSLTLPAVQRSGHIDPEGFPSWQHQILPKITHFNSSNCQNATMTSTQTQIVRARPASLLTVEPLDRIDSTRDTKNIYTLLTFLFRFKQTSSVLILRTWILNVSHLEAQRFFLTKMPNTSFDCRNLCYSKNNRYATHVYRRMEVFCTCESSILKHLTVLLHDSRKSRYVSVCLTQGQWNRTLYLLTNTSLDTATERAFLTMKYTLPVQVR